MTTFPYKVPALRVVQPLGFYYVVVLPARVLLETCFSDRLRAVPNATATGYDLQGTQRGISLERLRAIGAYIARYDSAFPNSIILAANYRDEDGMIEEDEARRWSITANGEGHILEIPSSAKLAVIIDGQHRLFGFNFAGANRLDTQLICAVLLDLPKPFQAQLFATINSTQRPANRPYELFGYNAAEEPEDYWSADKLAVFLARKLNADPDSALQGRIIIAADSDLQLGGAELNWFISMATVVDGILRLISTNPKRDTTELLIPKPKPRASLAQRVDRSPLRQLYLDGNDSLLFTLVKNYLKAADYVFWRQAGPGSFIIKTVGVQALFDVLRRLCTDAIEQKDVTFEFFKEKLDSAADIDFAGENFRSASRSGRINMRRAIESRIF